MQIVHGKSGWLEVICGPMFSGKSEELIKRIRRAQIARRRVQIFKHGIDARYDASNIVSHSQQSLPGVAVTNAQEILDLVDDRTELVAIDEGQFTRGVLHVNGQATEAGYLREARGGARLSSPWRS